MGGVVRQIAPAERVDGVVRVKIRDLSGKEGWVPRREGCVRMACCGVTG